MQGNILDTWQHRRSILTFIFNPLPFFTGVYFVVCMALLVISLTETVLIVRLVHKQDLQTPVPHWVKYLVLERAPVLFCIHKKHRLCSRLSSQASDLDYKDNNYGTGKIHQWICSVFGF